MKKENLDRLIMNNKEIRMLKIMGDGSFPSTESLKEALPNLETVGIEQIKFPNQAIPNR